MMNSTAIDPDVVPAESFEEVSKDTVKVSWASIFAGLFVALGAWALLSILGLAIGLSSVDPTDPSSLKTGTMVSGIWGVVVSLFALLIGGLVTARTAGFVSRPTGAIHGTVLWALTTIASLFVVGYVVKGVVGTALGVASTAVTTFAGAAGPAMAAGEHPMVGIGGQEFVAPVNEKLRAEGKPEVTAAQLESTVREIGMSAMRGGSMDRQVVVSSLTKNTQLSRADAESIATRMESTISERTNTARRDVETGVARAADRTGKAMWWAFLAMIVGLGSAVLGSVLGVSRRQRLGAVPPRRPIATATPSHV